MERKHATCNAIIQLHIKLGPAAQPQGCEMRGRDRPWSRDHEGTTTPQQFWVRAWPSSHDDKTNKNKSGKSHNTQSHNHTTRTPHTKKGETRKPEKQEAPRKPKETQGNPRKHDRIAGFPCVSCVSCVASRGSGISLLRLCTRRSSSSSAWLVAGVCSFVHFSGIWL